jgi:hypothetical protein
MFPQYRASTAKIAGLNGAPVIEILREVPNFICVLALSDCQLFWPLQIAGFPTALLLGHPQITLNGLCLSVDVVEPPQEFRRFDNNEVRAPALEAH